MSYAQSKIEIPFTTSIGNTDLSSTNTVGEQGRIIPLYAPFIVRAIAVQKLDAANATGMVLSFRDSSPASTGGGTATGDQFAVMTFTTADTATKVRYQDGLNQEISPGDALAVVVTTGASGGVFRASAYGEYRWETPANDATQVSTTA